MRSLPVLAFFVLTLAVIDAQQERLPLARLVEAPRLVMPGAIDSNVPMTWDLVEGRWRLFALASWGGVPSLLSGWALTEMQDQGPVTIVRHPGHGIWIESIIPDDAGAWYGYYHHETPAFACGRPDRSVPRVGALRSTDKGGSWEDLGVIFEAPPGTDACASTNRYVIGGVGDVSAMLSADRRDLFLFISQYSNVPSDQGVAIGRLAWADRDAPVGRVSIWRDGAWLPPRQVTGLADAETWEYPSGTPLWPPVRPWHDGQATADAFWGPSVHWNRYLERYVMLLNRARDESFNNEGIYVSYAETLSDPRAWSAPQKIMNGGGWYPQVAGLEPAIGSDKDADRRARFFVTGRSERFIEFQR